MAGYHVVRRTESHTRESVSPDHIIEQTLIRSLKSTGSLTRRTGFEEVQHNIYTLSRLACVEVSTSIEELAGAKYVSSNQRKSSSNSNVERGNTDIDKLKNNF